MAHTEPTEPMHSQSTHNDPPSLTDVQPPVLVRTPNHEITKKKERHPDGVGNAKPRELLKMPDKGALEKLISDLDEAAKPTYAQVDELLKEAVRYEKMRVTLVIALGKNDGAGMGAHWEDSVPRTPLDVQETFRVNYIMWELAGKPKSDFFPGHMMSLDLKGNPIDGAGTGGPELERELVITTKFTHHC